MLIWYRNSFLASMVSIVGSGAGIIAIMMLFSGEIVTGIACAAAAVVLLYLGKKISEKKSFDKWWQQVKKANLEPEIRRSIDTAMEIYRKNPEKRTLEKIRKLNPAAASYIENGFREKVPNTNPMPNSTASVQASVPLQPATAAQSCNAVQNYVFCVNCGQQLPLDSKFCSSCGTPVVGRNSGSTIEPVTVTRKQQASMKEQAEKEKKKVWFLLAGFVVILALLINGIYQDAKEETASTPAMAVEPEETQPKREKVAVKYDDPAERFEYETGYTFPIVFAEPLMGCREFTLEYEIIPLGETVNEDGVLCDVYGQTTTGEWTMIAAFQMEGTMETHRIYLNEPMDLAAVAVIYHDKPFAYDIRVYDPA